MFDFPVNLLSIAEFLTENKEPIFFSALLLSLVAGVFVTWSDILKKIFVFGFMLAIVFPTQDINFLVDIDYLGVPSGRGIYITLADLFLLSLAVGTIVGAGRQRPRIWFYGAAPYIVYTAVAALSLINMRSYAPVGFLNPGYAYGLFELANIVKGFLVFWVMVNFIRSHREIRMLLLAFMLIVVIEILSVLYWQYVRHSYQRAFGTLGHSNSLAMFIGMLMPLLLVLMLGYKKGGVMPWLLMVLFIGALAVMMRTFARAGLLSMIISCSIALALLVLSVRRLHAVRIAVLILVIGGGGAILANRFWDRIMARFGTETAEAEASTRDRLALLKIGWEIAMQNPVIGNGINSFPMEVMLQYTHNRAQQHNLYLLTFCEVGAVGLLAFLAAIGRVLHLAWRLYRQKLSPPLKILSIGLACGMLHAVIQSFFEFIFRAVFISYMFWLLAAIIVAGTYMLKTQERQMQIARVMFARRMAAMRQGDAEHAPQAALHARR